MAENIFNSNIVKKQKQEKAVNMKEMGFDEMSLSEKEQTNSWVIKISADGEIKPVQILDCTNILNALDTLGIIDKFGTYHNPLKDLPKEFERTTIAGTIKHIINQERDCNTEIEVRCNILLNEQKDAYNYIASKLLGETISGDVFINTQCYNYNNELVARGFDNKVHIHQLIEILKDMLDNNKTLQKLDTKTHIENRKDEIPKTEKQVKYNYPFSEFTLNNKSDDSNDTN